MARIFITGSADGLGLLAAKSLVGLGHQVVLHARDEARSLHAIKMVPGAESVLIADLSKLEEIKILAQRVNDSGRFDAVIHNAGVYQATANQIFTINTIAPYILTCLIQRPDRLIYLSSGLHKQGQPNFEHFNFTSPRISYADSKLHVVLLSIAVARKWSHVFSNAVDPGWVPTKMGGASAPDDLEKGFQTQVWLAVDNDAGAKVSGHYFYHKRQAQHHSAVTNVTLQEEFLSLCERLTGVSLVTS